MKHLICRIFGHNFTYGRAEIIARSITGEDADIGLVRHCRRCSASAVTQGIHHHYPKEVVYPMTEAQLREAFPSWFYDGP